MGEKLTARQEVFARNYALSGHGTKAAIQAGCKSKTAHVRASRWLREAKIQEQIWTLRAAAFRELRRKISQELYATILDGLESGCYKRGMRAVRLAERLGLFSGPQSKGRGAG